MAIVASRSLDLWNRALLAAALIFGVGLIIGAFTYPAYNSTGSTGTTTSTLVQVNGAGVLVPVAIPFALTVAVSAMLFWRSRRGKGAGVMAWTVTGLLCAFSFLGILTIGVFVLPVAVLLVVVCARS